MTAVHRIRAAIGLLLVVAAAAAAVVGGPARAVDEPVRVAATAWYTAGSTTSLGLLTIASGDLPVGRGPAGEDKRSYLALALPPSATAATLRLTTSSSPATSFGVPGRIAACAALEPWTPGAARDLATAPAVDCVGAPLAAVTSTGIEIDLAPLVARWRSGAPDLGIALVAVDAPVVAWQQTFAAPDGAVVGTAAVGGDDGDGAGPGSGDAGTGSGSGSADEGAGFPRPGDVSSGDAFTFDDGFGGGFDGGFDGGFGEAPAELGPIAQAAPTGGAGEQGARVASGTVGARLEPLPVHPLVWVGVLAGFAVLWVAGRSLGDAGRPRVPAVLGRGGGHDAWTAAPFQLAAGLVLVSALTIVVTWWGAGEQRTASTQLPYVLVGGGVGVGSAVVAGLLYAAQRRRLALADADRAAARLLQAAARLADATSARR